MSHRTCPRLERSITDSVLPTATPILSSVRKINWRASPAKRRGAQQLACFRCYRKHSVFIVAGVSEPCEFEGASATAVAFHPRGHRKHEDFSSPIQAIQQAVWASWLDSAGKLVRFSTTMISTLVETRVELPLPELGSRRYPCVAQLIAAGLGIVSFLFL